MNLQTAIFRTSLFTAILLLISGSVELLAQSTSDRRPVRVDSVVVRTAAAGKTFVGTIEPARRSLVGADVAGKVQEVFVEEGDLVDESDEADSGRLIQLRLDAARAQLAAAEAQLEVARQNLAELRAGPREEEKRRLTADVVSAEALFRFADKRFEQLKTLYDRNATDEGNLDQAESVRHAAEQTLISARAKLEEAENGARPEALLRSQAMVAVAQEEVNRLRDVFEHHTVRVPFRGYVARRYVEKGAWVGVGDPVAEIVELDQVEIRIAVPEEDISRITPATIVRLDVAAVRPVLSRADVLTGVIYRVVPDGDVRSRTFPVRVRVKNRPMGKLPLLKPGMLALVVLPVGEERESVFVPKDSLVLDGSRASVFVVDGDDAAATVREVEVTLGAADDLHIEVFPATPDALLNNGRVVTEGNERLTDGQLVDVYPDLP